MVAARPRARRFPGVDPRWLGLIFGGAALGTTVRSLLEGTWPAVPGAFPWTTFWINVSGSLLLVMLLEAIAESGRDRGWRRGLRLGVGTGVLGGFTTYSTFSVETVLLLRAGAWLPALGYALASVATGVAGAMLGVRLVRWTTRGLRRDAVARRAR